MADNALGGLNPGWSAVDTSSFRIQMPAFDPNDGAAGGEGTPGAGGQPGSGGTVTPEQQIAAGGAKPVAGAGGAEKTFSYKEDRTDWMPRHRFNEQNGKLTAAEQRAVTLEAELAQERKRVQALSGVAPIDPKKQEASEIRAQLYEMLPELKALEGLTKEQLQEVMQAATGARGATEAHWTRHASQMFTSLEAEVKTAMKLEKLSPTQSKGLQRAYREEAQVTAQARKRAQDTGDTSYDFANDFLARHERGDQTLVKEFAKAFLDDWYTPAQRAAAAAAVTRGMRPVPRGERQRVPLALGEKKVNLANDDEFKQALIAARAGGGRE